MATLVISPTAQCYDQWHWTFYWRELLPLAVQASILEQHFFPKWLNCLYGWLMSGGADLGEVHSWYQSWRQLIGEELAQQPTVKDGLHKALMMIDHSINEHNTGLLSFAAYYNAGGQQQQQPPPPNYSQQFVGANAYAQQQQQQQQAMDLQQHHHQQHLINFRTMVEQEAARHGILFMPMPNRQEAGKPIYRFGHSVVYIDDAVIFQQRLLGNQRTWAPILLPDLINQCLALDMQ